MEGGGLTQEGREASEACGESGMSNARMLSFAGHML